MSTSITHIQCPNLKCRQILVDTQEVFCPECGTRLPQASLAPPAPSTPGNIPAPSHSGVGTNTLTFASKGSRFGGFLIDIAITLLIAFLLIIPVIGQEIVGILWIAYFLFRDINGASPGKMALGNTVISKTGGPATSMQKIGRNFLLVLPDLALLIPGLGYFASPLVFLLILGIEGITLLTTNERLSDKLANTMVIKRKR